MLFAIDVPQGISAMARQTVDLELEQIRAIVRDLDRVLDAHEDPRSREPVLAGYGAIDHAAPDEALRLYGLFHRLSMWCWLTRHGDTLDSSAGLLRDLDQMSGSGCQESS